MPPQHSTNGQRARSLTRKSGDFNRLDSKSKYSATSNSTKLVHWPLMGGLLHLVQRGLGLGGLRPRLATRRHHDLQPHIAPALYALPRRMTPSRRQRAAATPPPTDQSHAAMERRPARLSPPISGQCTNLCMVRCSAVLMWRLKG